MLVPGRIEPVIEISFVRQIPFLNFALLIIHFRAAAHRVIHAVNTGVTVPIGKQLIGKRAGFPDGNGLLLRRFSALNVLPEIPEPICCHQVRRIFPTCVDHVQSGVIQGGFHFINGALRKGRSCLVCSAVCLTAN